MSKHDAIWLYEKYRFSDIENLIHYVFKNKQLLVTAFTHSTYAYENRTSKLPDNERLEFLGDGILDFVIADLLFHREMQVDEGFLSKTRALIVCEATLNDCAVELQIGQYLLLGKGEESTGGRQKPSNLANCMEAMFAAVYLDGGFDNAKKVIISILAKAIDAALAGEIILDYKSKILELAQQKGNNRLVRFEIIEEAGPVHNRVYTAALYVNDSILCTGVGASKKLAEQEAAKIAFAQWPSDYPN